MEADQRPHSIFYGWIIVAAAFTIVAMGMGLMFSLGVFMEPLEMAFGWGRGQIAQGIWCGGRFFDSLGTYNLMYTLSFAASGVGALLTLLLRPPRAHWRPVIPALAGS